MMPDHDDSRKMTLTPDDRLRLWAETIRHRRRLGLLPRRLILTALVAALAAVFGSRRSGGGR